METPASYQTLLLCLHELKQLSYRVKVCLPCFPVSTCHSSAEYTWLPLVSNSPSLSTSEPPASSFLAPQEVLDLELSEPLCLSHSHTRDHCSELGTHSEAIASINSSQVPFCLSHSSTYVPRCDVVYRITHDAGGTSSVALDWAWASMGT